MPILRTTGGCCGSVTEQLKAYLGRLGASTVREQGGCGLLQWVTTVDGRRKTEFRFEDATVAWTWEQCASMETKDEDNFKGMNQREVAEALGVSRTAVQQAEKRAMKKILKLLAKRKIKREDFFD